MVSTNIRMDTVYAFIQQKGKVSQPDIINKFLVEFGYSNKHCARSSISQLLSRLKNQDKIDFIEQPNSNAGSIMKKIWFIKK